MTLNQLMKIFGSQSQVARALGASRQNVNQWKTRGIPLDVQLQAEELAVGKVKARLPKYFRDKIDR